MEKIKNTFFWTNYHFIEQFPLQFVSIFIYIKIWSQTIYSFYSYHIFFVNIDILHSHKMIQIHCFLTYKTHYLLHWLIFHPFTYQHINILTLLTYSQQENMEVSQQTHPQNQQYYNRNEQLSLRKIINTRNNIIAYIYRWFIDYRICIILFT